MINRQVTRINARGFNEVFTILSMQKFNDFRYLSDLHQSYSWFWRHSHNLDKT